MPAHIADADGGTCLERCPHPAHHGPVQLTMRPEVADLVRDYLGNLDIAVEHFPTSPDEHDGMRQYVVTGSLDTGPLDGRLRVGNPPRTGTRWRR